MGVDFRSPEDIIHSALGVLENGDPQLLVALDEIAAPLYVTDADGFVTYFNEACIEFAGRTPVLRADRWCVTWKLFTDDGEFLPHDECPMAAAIRERRSIRGLTAVAERPDGTRVPFMPYPTPILKNGELVGAVNILVDVTDASQAAELWMQADRAHRLARAGFDKTTAETLGRLADEYAARALALGGPRKPSAIH
ncbi:PAS domain-containing protein [Sphingomonas sp. JC676]|uniref:PAS domain-containing protein n=1 Tax=Sphingomonas sp. JC676 TaxID=2768065 RepID=UPI001CA71C65|nr:PAS domain-containing protein [Sphingomonas sp. JC676]